MSKDQEIELISLGYIDINDDYELSMLFNEIYTERALIYCTFEELASPKKEYLTTIGIEVFKRLQILKFDFGIEIEGYDLCMQIWRKIKSENNQNNKVNSEKLVLDYKLDAAIRKENYLEAESLKRQIAAL